MKTTDKPLLEQGGYDSIFSDAPRASLSEFFSSLDVTESPHREGRFLASCLSNSFSTVDEEREISPSKMSPRIPLRRVK